MNTTSDLSRRIRSPLLDIDGATLRPVHEQLGAEQNSELRVYLNVLLQQRWLIGAVTLFALLCATVYVLVARPVYEANLVIHVEEESPNASRNLLSEMSSLFETKKAAIAEIELLRSRMVVSNAVDRLQLFVEAQPHTIPVLGFWFARHGGRELSTPGLFGHGDYVWGGEQIEVGLFEVPPAWQNRPFRLTALGGGRYRLHSDGLRQVITGTVGTPLRVALPEGELDLTVNVLKAKPGAGFNLRRKSRLQTIQAIQNDLQIMEMGKQSGIIAVRLRGDDPQRIHRVLSEIGREYLRQNFARKTEEAEKSLAFLNQQLPALKAQLEESEQRYNEFRNQHGTVDMREEGRMSMQRLAAARSRRMDLQQKRAELLARFTDQHPVLVALNQQRAEVDQEIADVSRRIHQLPMLEQEEARLAREIKVNTDVYTALSNTAQQLRLVSVGRVSNVRMVDAPMAPERPIYPKRPLVVALAGLVGLFIGGLAALARQAWRGGIADAATLERKLGRAAVYGSIPHSTQQSRLGTAPAAGGQRLLACRAPDDPAVEALRGLHAALWHALAQRDSKVVLLAGATRQLGRSFVLANLGAVLAAAGQRVLLVDAETAPGRLHEDFGLEAQPGWRDVLGTPDEAQAAVQPTGLPGLDLLAAGGQGRSAAELPAPSRVKTVLEGLASHYDVLLVDAPPVLDRADALTLGQVAGVVLLVVRAARSTESELADALKRLQQAGIEPLGLLFNDARERVRVAAPTERKVRRLALPGLRG
jgi:tyrosine-protein kinase Etk/Wzc